jgi:integrase
VLSDLDLVHGVISVNKARVAGVDRSSTKTGEDRRVELCPRALFVLKRHLRLHRRLKAAAGKIDHDHVFFQDSGRPMINLVYSYTRWSRTLRSLKLRYRKPYAARHSSVSWNLMVGKSPLWVAKQHGHSIETMLRVYAGWTEGAVETDLKAIRRAMRRGPDRCPRVEELASGLDSSPQLPTATDPDASVSRPQRKPTSSLANSREPRGRAGTRLAAGLAVRKPP